VHDFLAHRAAHIATATPGLAAARELSEMTDEAVRELSRAASSLHEGRWAIAALGGWGAGALLPASDLDILVLSETPAEKLKPFVEAVLYPLWDAGLKVGHQVRSPKQQKAAMREDIQTRTAALTGRPIAGDVVWAEQVLAGCAADAGKRAKRTLPELRDRDRPGHPWLLEPDLKNGAGGRRDYDELTWSAALLGGTVAHDPSALVGLGMLTGPELDTLADAAATVAAARWRLQREGFGDRLSLDVATDLAEAFDAELLQAALGDTALILERVRARTCRSAEPRSERFSAGELFERLDGGPDELPELLLAAQAGCIDGLVPGYRRLMAIRRPGLGHQLTVGAHCLTAACDITSLGGDPTLARSAQTAGDLRTAQVAALAHDIGKIEGGAGHAERGTRPAAQAAVALGLSESAASDVADLVRLHLVLIETALRDDLDDEDAILRCAAKVGRAELLAPLHLLTAADSRATGPATWTPWTAALVGTLVARVDAALSESVDGAGLASRGQAVRDATLQAMSATASADERAFVTQAPLRYLASREPAQVARDARLVAGLIAHGSAQQAAISVSAGPVVDTHTVTVAAKDRPQLLARLAGAVALAGLDILSVDAYSAPGTVVLDSFVVTSATRRPATTETFSALERFVDAALRDRLELATRLAERRRHYPARSRARVRVTTQHSGWDTAIIVTAPDRPGLLHDLARALTLEDVDIRWAKVLTIDGVARDTFHVVGPDGGPVDDPGVLGHLAMRIREAV